MTNVISVVFLNEKVNKKIVMCISIYILPICDNNQYYYPDNE